MTAYNHDCPPDDCGPCGTLPSGFVRLRYFYGKRLGVVDFIDEQRYHAGKLRFHNQRLHGAGVVCGLAVAPFADGETVLRVTKGAALDACGREIVVGYDQCIDVAAWFARWRADHPTWTPPADGILHLCVALRFRECPSGPEPAPRDPCACDATGSDYGRVREEFELELLVHDEAQPFLTPPLSPPRAEVAKALAAGEPGLATRIRGLLLAGCPEAEPGGWLVLSCFDATLANEAVTAIDGFVVEADPLFSTGLLQELVLALVSSGAEAGAWVAGPAITGLALEGTATPFTLRIPLSGPIVEGTLGGAAVTLRRLDPTGWQSVAVGALSYTASPPALAATVASPVPGLYRLAIEMPVAEPIVDDQLRPLRPLRPSFHFKVVAQGTGFAIEPAPYAA